MDKVFKLKNYEPVTEPESVTAPQVLAILVDEGGRNVIVVVDPVPTR